MVRLALRLIFIMVFVNGFACDSQGVCYHNTEQNKSYSDVTSFGAVAGLLVQSVGMTTVADLAARIAGIAYSIFERV